MRLLFLLGLVLTFCLSCMSVQSPLHPVELAPRPIKFHTLKFSDQVEKFLRDSWDSTNVYQVERIYCVEDYTYQVLNDTTDLITVQTIRGGHVVEAHPSSIRYECKNIAQRGKITWEYSLPTIHTHPPSNCTNQDTQCEYNDWRRYDCQPSMTDQITVALWRVPFGIVQCWNNSYGLYGVKVHE